MLRVAQSMAQSSSSAKGTVLFMLVFSLIGAFSLAVAGSDFYHWWFTGNLYFPAKYGHGVYASHAEAPELFAAAVLKNLLILVMGVVCVLAACTAPSFSRRREQARLATTKVRPSHPPWPRRPKTPS